MFKQIKNIISVSVLSLASLTLMCMITTNAQAQTRCSTVGDIKRFDFENATLRDIEVRTVTENCKENSGKVLTPGQKIGGNSYSGTVFRVYETGTQRFMAEFVLGESGADFKVENCSKEGQAAFGVKFQNSRPQTIEIRKVGAKCEESSVKELGPGEIFENSSNVDAVYRVYDSESKNLLDEIIVGGAKGVIKIENCSKSGTPRFIFIRNGSAKDVEVRRVNEDCTEQKLASVTPGRMFETKSFAGNVYRVYEKGTEKFIDEFDIQPRVSSYLVEVAKNDDPQQGFLDTTNQFRAGINLPPFQIDDSLSKACQWFAEFMAAEDKGYPVHNVSELRKDKPFSDRNTSAKRIVYFGYDKKNKAHFEVTILDTVPDIKLLGSHFALAWSSSDTHDAPFFDKDRTKFNRVGFGYANAKSGGTKYYACALFGKK